MPRGRYRRDGRRLWSVAVWKDNTCRWESRGSRLLLSSEDEAGIRDFRYSVLVRQLIDHPRLRAAEVAYNPPKHLRFA